MLPVRVTPLDWAAPAATIVADNPAGGVSPRAWGDGASNQEPRVTSRDVQEHGPIR
jgi:hypothetical protein